VKNVGATKARSRTIGKPQPGHPQTERMAALIAWMLVVRVDLLVKGGANAPPPPAVFDP